MRGSRFPVRRADRGPVGRLAPLAAAAALAVTLGGCAKMDATLGQQWVQVTFKSGTTLATIEKVQAACSRIPNVHAGPLPKQHTAINLMAGLRYDTTNATDADVAELELCVQKFSSVQGFTPQDSGDDGG